ncbi:MAG: hypothetical protein K2N94_17035 [Lachnospiraceae bacterium]|nr:hypothetical protein [Lachnospiraceae bacterium]
MVIQSGNVAMRSSHQYSQTSLEAVSYAGWGNAVNQTGGTLATAPSATDSEQATGRTTNSRESGTAGYGVIYSEMQTDFERLFVRTEDEEIVLGEDKKEYEGLRNLLMLLSGKRELPTRKISAKRLMDEMRDRFQKQMDDALMALGSRPAGRAYYQQVRPTQSFGSSLSVRHFYEEKESTSFYSSGTVITADGRQIEFDLEALMSRSFTENTEVQIDYGAAQLMDPLVISLDGGTAKVSDQKLLFDIDCDGELDNISLLAQGCGFLALDRNGDGEINDGSELFGAGTGNGFAELAVFDMDGNGWIDENDEIFNRLRIWTKDESGNDKLVALGVAGVGAIYLGSASTQFSLNSEADNTTNAVVRSSGIFLHEDGTAGMVQQIDLAVSPAEKISLAAV